MDANNAQRNLYIWAESAIPSLRVIVIRILALMLVLGRLMSGMAMSMSMSMTSTMKTTMAMKRYEMLTLYSIFCG